MTALTIQKDGTIDATNGSHPWQSTCLQGEIDVAYTRLVEVFGEPNVDPDYEKTDAEWEILTPDGIATIYNYKDGHSYCGVDGDDVEDIRDWHIGGTGPEVLPWIQNALALPKPSVHLAGKTVCLKCGADFRDKPLKLMYRGTVTHRARVTSDGDVVADRRVLNTDIDDTDVYGACCSVCHYPLPECDYIPDTWE